MSYFREFKDFFKSLGVSLKEAFKVSYSRQARPEVDLKEISKKIEGEIKERAERIGVPQPKSEFGRGLVINLVKFAEHFNSSMSQRINDVHTFYKQLEGDPEKLEQYDRRLRDNVRMFQDIELKVSKEIFPQYDEITHVRKSFSRLICLWANGATDHLYDMIVPKRWKGTELEKKVGELRELGLTMGHGFTGRIWTYSDFIKLLDLTKEIAMMIDANIGLKRQVDLGKF